jgi:hypothetical protein
VGMRNAPSIREGWRTPRMIEHLASAFYAGGTASLFA